MPEGDLRGSLMRLNSHDQFPASSGYSDCQNVTTPADRHSKAGVMASWHVQTEVNSEITTPSVGHPPLSLGCTLVQLQCLSLIIQRCISHQLQIVGQ